MSGWAEKIGAIGRRITTTLGRHDEAKCGGAEELPVVLGYPQYSNRLDGAIDYSFGLRFLFRGLPPSGQMKCLRFFA